MQVSPQTCKSKCTFSTVFVIRKRVRSTDHRSALHRQPGAYRYFFWSRLISYSLVGGIRENMSPLVLECHDVIVPALCPTTEALHSVQVVSLPLSLGCRQQVRNLERGSPTYPILNTAKAILSKEKMFHRTGGNVFNKCKCTLAKSWYKQHQNSGP